MFDKFGEFGSAEELNRAAAAQLQEGDTEAVYEIAKENGIDKEDAEDYVDGRIKELTSPLMAAMGKIKVEAEDLELGGVLRDWSDLILQRCTEEGPFALAVRKKGKSTRECMAILIEYAFENKVQVSDKIVDLVEITNNGKKEQMRKPLYLGTPSTAETKKIIGEYYMTAEGKK